MTIEEQITGFNPDGPGLPGQLFGLPFTPETSQLVVIPVPWEATVSYGRGTSLGPDAILQASRQIDFHHREVQDAWKLGVAMVSVPAEIKDENERVQVLASQHRSADPGDESASFIARKVNEACENLNVFVRSTTQKYIHENKLVALVGGDHSTPLGFIRALSEKHERFGILQIDAHPDLRKAHEGFIYSHGSIMHNALKIPGVNRLVQVGIRDSSPEDADMMKRGHGRVKTYFYDELVSRLDDGTSWARLCEEIVQELPDKVYISFDIDGLDPKLCPHTGTLVPGGLEFHQAIMLIKTVASSKKTIIGFDLCEVGNNEWDGNVGARILWELCVLMGVSNGKLSMTK